MVQMLSIEEVNGLTGIPVATLRYWRARGEGPKSFRLGKRVRYKREDVDAWIEEQYQATSTRDAS